jgi:type I restriction enzyme R subunit
VTQTPEQQARRDIDAALAEAGWVVQDRDQLNLSAGPGVAVREFKLASGHGFADYLLFVEKKAVGVVEAKPAGHTLTGVEPQAQKYATGLPPELTTPVRPLPFLYLSTGAVTRFTNGLDPTPKSRRVFQVHRPETLAEWLAADTLSDWVGGWSPGFQVAEQPARGGQYGARPSSLRARLRELPAVPTQGLWLNQVEAITRLEESLRKDRPRALIQMATGSGKSRFAVMAAYRLIKYGGARRVVFLVDRANLGEQAEKEFASFRTPDDRRKFTELYNVQRLTGNTVGSSSKVVITTIQRLFSILKGEPDLAPEVEELGSQFAAVDDQAEPIPVQYNQAIPPEFFDVLVVDECHRSIYTLWRHVLEYFDAYLIGLTATPATHTFGFFNKNLVMEYGHERAVADSVNVDFEVYRIKTQITEQGSTIEATGDPILGKRDRLTRKTRWEAPDEDVSYSAEDLDRNVVAKDQIRLIIRTFRERLFTEIFPGRREVPKTLIFAKDDSHAEDIVEIIRDEFGRGNDFCTKITYKTTGKPSAVLIQEFRNSYQPRIAVTVDMIATGTDIKPVEIVMFMRAVKSRVLFEQMKGRGVRVIDPTELQAVTPDAVRKTHFVIVDCVGVTESAIGETHPLDQKKAVAFKTLLEHVASGGTDHDMVSSLVSRLARLNRRCGPEEEQEIRQASGGKSLTALTGDLVDALDLDRQVDVARTQFAVPAGQEPTTEQVRQVESQLVAAAVVPIATRPELRKTLVEIKRRFEQIIDEVSEDVLLFAGASPEATEKARTLVTSFERFLADNAAEIDALAFFFHQEGHPRLSFRDVKTLAAAIQSPPRSWTPDVLWRAYETLDKDRVRGASGQRLLTDIVSLVKFALRQDDELVPFGEQVRQRYQNWVAQQDNRGRRFTEQQLRWLTMIRDHVATSLEITLDDFEAVPFVGEGGLGRARQVFGTELGPILRELNEVLAA